MSCLACLIALCALAAAARAQDPPLKPRYEVRASPGVQRRGE
jgi:hypothetical protein